MLGNKQFELSNHLGNVLTTVSDRKIPHTSDNITIDYYTSDITSAQDYYAFGQLMPGRNWSSNSYKFGFNGKLNDNEVFGATGSFQDYGMRMYDTRTCRFMGVDPLTSKYPMLTPYQFASNTPIQAIDLDGLEGLQYLQIMKTSNNDKTVIKRIVEVDVHVAVSQKAESNHFKSSEVKSIESNLNKEYNNNEYKDANGNEVEFVFNMIEFDVDNTTSEDYAKKLKINSDNYIKTKNGITMAAKGFVIEKSNLDGNTQGSTRQNHVKISKTANNSSHTEAHETGHIFLNYSNSPIITVSEHENAGGIFKYAEVDNMGNTLSPTEDLNQDNVNIFLKTLPEVNDNIIINYE